MNNRREKIRFRILVPLLASLLIMAAVSHGISYLQNRHLDTVMKGRLSTLEELFAEVVNREAAAMGGS